MDHAAGNDHGLDWTLRGPDANGHTWLDLTLETFNLGPYNAVRERIAGLLAWLDLGAFEQGGKPKPWDLTVQEGCIILYWDGSGEREDVDLGRVEPVVLAFTTWLAKTAPE